MSHAAVSAHRPVTGSANHEDTQPTRSAGCQGPTRQFLQGPVKSTPVACQWLSSPAGHGRGPVLNRGVSPPILEAVILVARSLLFSNNARMAYRRDSQNHSPNWNRRRKGSQVTEGQLHKAKSHHCEGVLDPASRDFYVHTLRLLHEGGVPFMLGGAYAFAQYTGIERHTKDLDIFVRPADVERTLDVLGAGGYDARLEFPHWLGKAHCGGDFVDIIFSSGNGACPVTDDWFAHAERSKVFGVPVLLTPAEEMLWQKALILERERYDGADVAHIIHCRAEQLDWPRLVRLFGPNWRVLLSHLVLFGFVYPSERDRIPAEVLQELVNLLVAEQSLAAPAEKICHGTILSRKQYLTDVHCWGYADARLENGSMSATEVQLWTEAIEPDTHSSEDTTTHKE